MRKIRNGKRKSNAWGRLCGSCDMWRALVASLELTGGETERGGQRPLHSFAYESSGQGIFMSGGKSTVRGVPWKSRSSTDALNFGQTPPVSEPLLLHFWRAGSTRWRLKPFLACPGKPGPGLQAQGSQGRGGIAGAGEHGLLHECPLFFPPLGHLCVEAPSLLLSQSVYTVTC